MSLAFDDRHYPANGRAGSRSLTNADIRDPELERARHALAYLKRKLGNDAVRALLDDDLQAMQATVRNRVCGVRRMCVTALLRHHGTRRILLWRGVQRGLQPGRRRAGQRQHSPAAARCCAPHVGRRAEARSGRHGAVRSRP